MQSVTERYLVFYNYLLSNKLVKNATEFSNLIGVSSSMITEMSKGRSKVGLETLQNTVKCYPQLNSNWVLCEAGDMLITESPSATAEGVDDKNRIKSLETSLRSIQKIQKQTSDHVLELKEMLSLALAAIGKTPVVKAAGKKGNKTGAARE